MSFYFSRGTEDERERERQRTAEDRVGGGGAATAVAAGGSRCPSLLRLLPLPPLFP